MRASRVHWLKWIFWKEKGRPPVKAAWNDERSEVIRKSEFRLLKKAWLTIRPAAVAAMRRTKTFR